MASVTYYTRSFTPTNFASIDCSTIAMFGENVDNVCILCGYRLLSIVCTYLGLFVSLHGLQNAPKICMIQRKRVVWQWWQY